MTDFVYEIACSGDRAAKDAVRAWVNRDAGPAWGALPGLSAVDVYEMVPTGTHDPFVNDGPGPLLLAMLQFPTIEALAGALSHQRFKQSLAGRPASARFHRHEPCAPVFSDCWLCRARPAARAVFLCRPLSPSGARRGAVRFTLSRRPSARYWPSCRKSDRCCAICRSTSPRRVSCHRRTTCSAMKLHSIRPRPSMPRWRRPSVWNCARTFAVSRPSPDAIPIIQCCAGDYRVRHRDPR